MSLSTPIRTAPGLLLLLAVALLIFVGSSPFAPAQDATEATPSSTEAAQWDLQDAIELAEIRYEIRMQEVAIAKAERRASAPGVEYALQQVEAAKQNLVMIEHHAERVRRLTEEGTVSVHDTHEAAAKLAQARAELVRAEAQVAHANQHEAVSDEKIKLLELKAKAVETKVSQLRRRRKRLD